MADELIVICNGPSLADVDISFLKSRPSFGTNGIYLLDGFLPSVYFATDQAFITGRADEIRRVAAAITTYIRRPWNEQIEGSEPVCKVIDHLWSYTPLVWVGSGGGTPYAMLQFAFASEAQKVLIVGLDFDYFDKPRRADHFDKDYLTGLEHPFVNKSDEKKLDYWKNQKKLCSQGFQWARDVFEAGGKEIINLTPGSQCDVFERGEIEDYA